MQFGNKVWAEECAVQDCGPACRPCPAFSTPAVSSTSRFLLFASARSLLISSSSFFRTCFRQEIRRCGAATQSGTCAEDAAALVQSGMGGRSAMQPVVSAMSPEPFV